MRIFPATEDGISFADSKGKGTQILRTSCDGAEGALFMMKFYSRPALVVLFAYLFFGASSARAQEDYWLQQKLEQLQQQQQLDQLQREQEQNQLQRQLNDMQPVERQQQLNELQQQIDQPQLEHQQNQLRQQQQLDQLREEERLNQPQRRQQFDQFQRNSFSNFSGNNSSINCRSSSRKCVSNRN
jgi:predicted membrane metal-binding protein